MLFDVATSAVAGNKIGLAARVGSHLFPGWMTDKEGNMPCFTAARLLLIGVLCGTLCTLAAAETLTVTASQAKVYARPDTKSRVLASVPRGTSVSLLEQRAGWYQIALTDGSTGWVAEAQVARAPETAAPTRGIVGNVL